MSSPLSSGKKLGRYEIHSKIGEGGMGEVYRAYDPKLNREVAIKVLSATFSADRDQLARFEHLARDIQPINHQCLQRWQFQTTAHCATCSSLCGD